MSIPSPQRVELVQHAPGGLDLRHPTSVAGGIEKRAEGQALVGAQTRMIRLGTPHGARNPLARASGRWIRIPVMVPAERIGVDGYFLRVGAFLEPDTPGRTGWRTVRNDASRDNLRANNPLA